MGGGRAEQEEKGRTRMLSEQRGQAQHRFSLAAPPTPSLGVPGHPGLTDLVHWVRASAKPDVRRGSRDILAEDLEVALCGIKMNGPAYG